MTIEELKAEVVELRRKLAIAEQMVKDAYNKGLQASREFDSEMDGFLIKFLRRDDSHIIIFAIALGLVSAGFALGTFL